MTTSKIVKTILFSLVYGINIFYAMCLWLCGADGNIMLGIIFIVLYRLSLWFAPVAVTIVCWLPLRPKVPLKIKLLSNLVHLAICGLLFVLCYLLFGNWY